LADREPDIVERFGVKLLLDAAVMSPFMTSVIEEGWYEAEEVKFLTRAIRSNDRVLELGGGIGFISSFVALHTPAAFVATIEANPQLIPLMRRVHALNGVTVDVTWGIVAREAGVASLNMHENFWSSSTLGQGAGDDRVEVPVHTLTDLVRTVRPQVLIVDIEGSEQNLFSALALDGVRDIVLELHEHIIGTAGVQSVLAELAALGFGTRTDTPSSSYVVGLSRTTA